MTEMVMSLLKHVSNIHSWKDGEMVDKCWHEPLDPAAARSKKWLYFGSPAYKVKGTVQAGRRVGTWEGDRWSKDYRLRTIGRKLIGE